jgi:phospholipid/cholesterol/gamma-HCH transport system permease protein
LRELGVLMTAIIVAGRSGSAFTAQIGAMEVNEEIDALRTIGLDPIEVLVLPRVLGLMLTLPLLTFFANIMALLGGGLMVVLVLDIPMVQFLRQLSTAVKMTTLWAGLIKAPVFAFIIAMVGCFEGLRVSRSAESVGQLTTTSVVLSIFLVILVDAVFSIVFAQLGF